jgi:hypothetical protein
MFDVIFYSFSAGFFSILLGVGIYILYREKINEFPVKEKINGLITHFQKYRYWYIAIIIIMLAPILYYSWDIFFNPHRIIHFPEPNVPPPQLVDNEENFFDSLGSFVIYALTTFARCLPFMVFLYSFVLLMLGPRIFKRSKYGFLFQSLTGITTSISMVYVIVILVANLFVLIYLILSFSGIL